jgi:hypothetical protein
MFKEISQVFLYESEEQARLIGESSIYHEKTEPVKVIELGFYGYPYVSKFPDSRELLKIKEELKTLQSKPNA